MRLFIYILSFFIYNQLLSQEKNFSNEIKLKKIYNSIYFFNIISKDETLYVGTDDGVYEIEDNSLKKINNEKGYVHYNLKSKKLETKDFVEGVLDKSIYKYVIKNGNKREGFTLTLNDNFYIVYDGLLYHYIKKNYKASLKGTSIRSFSENYIGTYSGVYDKALNSKKIINYVNGKIREFKNNTFICYDGLIRIYNDSIINYTNEINIQTSINNTDLGFARDISKIGETKFILYTDRSINLLDFKNEKEIIVKTKKRNNESIYISEQINEVNSSLQRIMISSENRIEYLNPYTLETFERFRLEDEIISALELNSTIKPKHLLVSTNKKLFLISRNDEKIEIDNNKYHSLLQFDNKNVILTNNFGLFLLDLNTLKIKELIKGKEFNKGALYKENDKILAGSVNGFIEMKVYENISEKNSKNYWNQEGKFTLIFAIIIIITIFLITVIKKGKKEKRSTKLKETTITDIENFINSNLTNVSLNLICDHFNISLRTLYRITKPKKPGDLIKHQREQKVKELIDKNEHTLNEIGAMTGYSLSYLRNNRKKFLK